MTTPILSAVPVPVPAVVRPGFWLVLCPRANKTNYRSQYAWGEDLYQSKSDAEDDAAQTPGAVVFYLPGSEEVQP